MAQEQKNTKLKPEHLSDEQMGGVSGGADNLVRDITEWESEGRSTKLEGYVCPVCGTADSTYANGKMGGWDPGPNGATIPVSNYQDCKCYNCGRQVGEISYFPNTGGPAGIVK